MRKLWDRADFGDWKNWVISILIEEVGLSCETWIL